MTFGGDPWKAVAGLSFAGEFNCRAQLGGNFGWRLACHPYPENLFQPRTWLDKSALPSPDSPRITFKNRTATGPRSQRLYRALLLP